MWAQLSCESTPMSLEVRRTVSGPAFKCSTRTWLLSAKHNRTATAAHTRTQGPYQSSRRCLSLAKWVARASLVVRR